MKNQLKKPVESTETVPIQTIMAFGDRRKTEIWTRETNKWTDWRKGIDCGHLYACVKAHSNIYFIDWRVEAKGDKKETRVFFRRDRDL